MSLHMYGWMCCVTDLHPTWWFWVLNLNNRPGDPLGIMFDPENLR